ncbi:DUF4138 domain-containing protein [Flagellimonas profundi]|uniref:DUF4138 domain-containing protein n=1 Tax=Flagellimonas profundi TaxID=2915620 RepID=A0ABS3FEF6_9FLAO|nr:DUF4138 domain-containing protein [Allomuricauda profundi]MBO0341496.1 DUF4138 domain-containing protein [Allomuricauda profundi]|tara:strand:+ start:1766 stop:2554 length:789 start_codon:yes stop_codon:yes gene_type:complete
MKIKSILISLMAFVLGPFVWGQEALDTLYANAQMNVALFFPSPIKQAITGNENAVFSYDREEAHYFGLLQAIKGTTTNLWVMTLDGYAYEFKVAYKDRLPRTHLFLNEQHSLGGVRPLPARKLDTLFEDGTRLALMEQLLQQQNGENLGTVRSKGMQLRLEKKVYQGGEMFLVFELRNKSGIDYDLETLDILRINGSPKSKTSYQETPLEPQLRFQQPETIKSGSTYRFVHVYPKYVTGAHERLKMVLLERQGGRRLELFIK